MKRRIIVFAVIVSVALSLLYIYSLMEKKSPESGDLPNTSQSPGVTEVPTVIDPEDDDQSAIILALQERLEQLEGALSRQESIIRSQVDLITQLLEVENQGDYQLHAIYSADVDSYEKYIDFYTLVPSETDLTFRLNELITALSERVFALPITLLRIDSVDGKRVAIINLEESLSNQALASPLDYRGASWAAVYFQGSTGGIITTVTLEETLLQRQQEMDWIEGVRFLYQGKPIEFDHVYTLSEVIWR